MGAWSQPLFPIPLQGGSSDTLPVLAGSVSATTWDESECQREDWGGFFFFPWCLLHGRFSTSTFFWSLLDVRPAVLYRILFISTCKCFFPPSCYYDYPLGSMKNCFLFVHWGNIPFPTVNCYPTTDWGLLLWIWVVLSPQIHPVDACIVS